LRLFCYTPLIQHDPAFYTLTLQITTTKQQQLCKAHNHYL